MTVIDPNNGGRRAMLVKLIADVVKTQTFTCGEVDMILSSADYSKLNVVICPNIKSTIAHYHQGFDERGAAHAGRW
jgi:hypothetical protein